MVKFRRSKLFGHSPFTSAKYKNPPLLKRKKRRRRRRHKQTRRRRHQ